MMTLYNIFTTLPLPSGLIPGVNYEIFVTSVNGISEAMPVLVSLSTPTESGSTEGIIIMLLPTGSLVLDLLVNPLPTRVIVSYPGLAKHGQDMKLRNC